jgi:general secretion pathway protein A
MPTVEESVRTLRGKLQQNVRAKHHALIVIDEAHLIQDPKTLDALRLLLNFETDGVGGLTLLFAGQPSLLPMIDRHRDLEERIAVKCLLRPLDLEETIAYVHHRLLAAGGSRPIFTNAALEALHALANGNPRQINRLCDLSLLIGFAEEQHEIDAPAVEAVSNELVSVTPE